MWTKTDDFEGYGIIDIGKLYFNNKYYIYTLTD